MVRNNGNKYYVKNKMKRPQLNIYKSKFRQRISRWKQTKTAPLIYHIYIQILGNNVDEYHVKNTAMISFI